MADLSFLAQEVKALREKKLDWRHYTLESPSVPHAQVNGKNVLMLCSNNYLGFANHPKLKAAAKQAIDQYGAGNGSVPAIAGTMDLMLTLEEKLAKFKRSEAALVTQTGFAANAGLIPQLVGKGDLIISDELNHGSIIDGVRLSQADRAVFKHADATDLDRVLKEKAKTARRVLVCTDGVFSMDGDVAPLKEIYSVASAYDAIVYVDDAHGDGVMGPEGRGTIHHYHLENQIDVDVGTFSKAFGAFGGYVSGIHALKEFTFNKSRTWLLSAGHPPSVWASVMASIELLESEPQHLKTLWDNTHYFKKRLREMGFNTGRSTTPITPVIVGESAVAHHLSQRLFQEGVFALPIVFPMVARDQARVRVMMNAALSRSDLDFALNAFENIGKELQIVS
ncbi:aminotransferase class I/II-fold pyridoxal phosphate-dependent enzyme [Candidatus Micrarchaeota archaeon]|nr:aminotransferase class I/II-fold pyridoxal phosphate-dependent enzyme [Candidatus Micrarchaeota archaeon]